MLNHILEGFIPILSIVQKHNWSGYQGYCQSKLAQIMLTVELAKEYQKDCNFNKGRSKVTKVAKAVVSHLTGGKLYDRAKYSGGWRVDCGA